MFFSNEKNRLISKQMSNIFHWEKLMFSKLARKVNFLERKTEECTSFEEQEGLRTTVCNKQVDPV